MGLTRRVLAMMSIIALVGGMMVGIGCKGEESAAPADQAIKAPDGAAQDAATQADDADTDKALKTAGDALKKEADKAD